MKKALLVLLALITATTVFANGQKEEKGKSVPAMDPNKMYELNIGCFGDFESIVNAIQATDDWKKTFPNVKLVPQPADYGGHHNRLVTVFAAGDGANTLEYVDFGYIGQFVSMGYLTNLSDKYNAEEVVKNSAKFAVDNARNFEGKLEAMPVDLAPSVIYYNVELAEASGVSQAQMESMQTWDDFYAIAAKLTRDTDGDGAIDQWAIPHPTDISDVPLNGGKGNWFKNGKPFEPKAKFMGALNMVDKVRSNGWDANFGQWSGEWTSGIYKSFVIFPTGAWMLGHLQNWMAPDLAGKIRVAKLPAKEPVASNGGSYITVPTSTPDDLKDVAFKVAAYLASNDNAQKTALKASGAFPVKTTLYKDSIMSEPVEYLGGQKAREIFAELVLKIPANEVTQFDAALLSVWRTAVSNIINGEATVDEAYNAAVKEALVLIQ